MWRGFNKGAMSYMHTTLHYIPYCALRVLTPDIKDDRSQPSQCQKNAARGVCIDCSAEPMKSHIDLRTQVLIWEPMGEAQR